MSELPFTVAVKALATLIAESLTDEELELAAVALTQAADTMATVLVLRNQRNETSSLSQESEEKEEKDS